MGAIELLRKKALMMESAGGYAELKYLQSSGTQHFLISFPMSGNDFYKDIQFDAKIVWGWVYGTMHNMLVSGLWNALSFFDGDATFYRLDWNGKSKPSLNSQRHLYRVHGGGLYIDNVLAAASGTSAGESSDKFCVFGAYDLWQNAVGEHLVGTIYSLQLMQGSTVQSEFEPLYYYHKFVPRLRLSDNKPGMLDLVSGEFFVNQGTGEFGYETLDGIIVAPI